MKLYKATLKIFGDNPKKLITVMDVTAKNKSYIYENTRIPKKDLNVFKSKFTDSHKIFTRYAFFLTQVEAENAIEDMLDLSINHFKSIIREAESSLISTTNKEFLFSEIEISEDS